jgi:hypothetical protein
MDQIPNLDWLDVGASAVGFYLFLSVWVGMAIWARTKERLAVQETLRRVVDSGTALTPEVIDALRRPKPKRSQEEIGASIRRYLFWGLFLLLLAFVLELLAGWDGGGVLFFGVPGAFCLAHSLITRATHLRQPQ